MLSIVSIFSLINFFIVDSYKEHPEVFSPINKEFAWGLSCFGTLIVSLCAWRFNHDNEKSSGAIECGITSAVTCLGFYAIGHYPTQGYKAVAWGLLGLIPTFIFSIPQVAGAMETVYLN